jgi:hypothetical protein
VLSAFPPHRWPSSIACCWPWLGLLFRGPSCRTSILITAFTVKLVPVRFIRNYFYFCFCDGFYCETNFLLKVRIVTTGLASDHIYWFVLTYYADTNNLSETLCCSVNSEPPTSSHWIYAALSFPYEKKILRDWSVLFTDNVCKHILHTFI